ALAFNAEFTDERIVRLQQTFQLHAVRGVPSSSRHRVLVVLDEVASRPLGGETCQRTVYSMSVQYIGGAIAFSNTEEVKNEWPASRERQLTDHPSFNPPPAFEDMPRVR